MTGDAIPVSPYGDFLGIKIIEFTEGKGVCHLKLKEHHRNNGVGFMVGC